MRNSIQLKPHLREFKKQLAVADNLRVGTAKTAVKVELYRLGNKLRTDIRSGKYASPGLSAIAWWTKRRRMGTQPLMRLYSFVGYKVDIKKTGLSAELGFVGNRVTVHWRKIIQKLQSGFSALVTDKMRSYFIRKGVGLSGGKGAARSQEAKYFFLRHTTKTLHTPARNIIEPFWANNYNEAWRNIKSNYLRKMDGDRI